MNNFTFEEQSLINIFKKERPVNQSRQDIIKQMEFTLPYMDEDIRILVEQTVQKLNNTSDETFLQQTFIFDL